MTKIVFRIPAFSRMIFSDHQELNNRMERLTSPAAKSIATRNEERRFLLSECM